MHEHFSSRFRPIGKKVPDYGFIEKPSRGRQAENKLCQSLHYVIRLHYL
jgi:hypothetical protein